MDIVNERDFCNEESLFFSQQSCLLKKNFEKRNLPCSILNSSSEVYEYLETFISDRPYIKSIAFSDGVTLYQLNLFDWIKSNYGHLDIIQPLERSATGHYKVFGNQPIGRMNLPYDEWKEKDDLWYQKCRESLLCDLLIISANAITLNGEIVSIDGLGNRVGGMFFGPKHVVCIVGKNKISTNLESALDRIHNHVVPMTYIRHMMKHSASFSEVPCVKLGKCTNCSHEYSSCRDVAILRGQIKRHKDRIHLVVINEKLGF